MKPHSPSIPLSNQHLLSISQCKEEPTLPTLPFYVLNPCPFGQLSLQIMSALMWSSDWLLAFTGPCCIVEHLLASSTTSCSPPFVLVELAPAVSTQQNSDANQA
uniref:Uncharacterized protein n=1 Tax=Anguilla anguilla TaxID=7936 RepID=A0A0E9X9G3_ANGAN